MSEPKLIRITALNASSSRYLFLGKQRFTRSDRYHHEHVCELTRKEFEKALPDLDIRLGANIRTKIQLLSPDVKADVKEEKREDVALLKQRIEELEMERDVALSGTAGITPEEKQFLLERDTLIDILAKVAKPGETPVQVAERLVTPKQRKKHDAP